MPKVLPEYLQRRRQQILDAAGACFCRDGFHQTTMQDICQCAELSPGALYRYFPSKEEIIRAIGEEACDRDLEHIEAIKAEGDDAFQVMENLAREFFSRIDHPNLGLDIELWAEARRNPQVKATWQRGHQAIIDSFSDFARTAQARGQISPQLDPEAIARVFASLFQGLVLQKAFADDIDVWKYVDVVMAMGRGMFTTAARTEPSSAGPTRQNH